MQKSAIIQKFFDRVICHRKFHLLSDIVTDDVVYIAPKAMGIGRLAAQQAFEVSGQAFKPSHVDVQFAAEIGERAAARVCLLGRESNALAGIRNSGRRISLPCVYLFEFRGSRICKIEVYCDLQSLTSQIGHSQVHSVR